MTDAIARAFGKQIAEMIRRIETLEQEGAFAQLGSSSVHNGVIPFYDLDGSVRSSIGSAGVLLSDPDGLSQSSVDLTGALSSSAVNIIDSLNYRGEELSSHLGSKSRGLVAWCLFNDGNTTATASTLGIVQLDVLIKAGYVYEILTYPIYMRAASGTPGTRRCSIDLRFTVDGTNPTINSPYLAGCNGLDEQALSISTLFAWNTDVTLKMLLSISNYSDTSVYAECNGDHQIGMWVNETSSVIMPSTGRRTTGGGGGSTPQQYVKTYNSTWSRQWDAGGIHNSFFLAQGYFQNSSGDWRSLFGFDTTTIQSNLAGATILKAELFLKASYWINNDGGYARLRTSNTKTPPPVDYPLDVSPSRWVPKLAKPGSLWVDLGTALGDEFKAGTTGSFALDATDVPRNNADAGLLSSALLSSRPALRVTYIK